jgi:hypothetical protein
MGTVGSKVWGIFFVSERGKKRKRIERMTIEVMEPWRG